MKKRLRRKLHKGEFQQFGISLFVPTNIDDAEKHLDIILDVADNNNILFIGGGFGLISMPSEEYNNLDVPKKIVTLITFIALSKEKQSEGIIGYFIKPFENEICNDVAEKVKSELETALRADFNLNSRIDLWN